VYIQKHSRKMFGKNVEIQGSEHHGHVTSIDHVTWRDLRDAEVEPNPSLSNVQLHILSLRQFALRPLFTRIYPLQSNPCVNGVDGIISSGRKTTALGSNGLVMS
jgi:hypothetical protein